MIPLYKKTNSPYWFADLRSVGGGRVSTKRTNKRDAAKVADHMRTRALDKIQLGTQDELSVKDALDRYIRELDSDSYIRERKTDRDKLLGLNRWEGRDVHQWSAEMLMSEITTASMAELQDKRRGEGLSNASINSETKMVQRVYNLCSKEWGVNVHPGVAFRTFKTKTRMRRLSDEDEARLLLELNPSRKIKSVPNDPTSPRRLQMQDAYDLAIFLIDTGCRTGEATDVRWDQVSLEDGTVAFYRTKVQNEGLAAMTRRVKEMLVRRRSTYPGARYVFPRWDKLRVDGRFPRSGRYSLRAISKAIDRAGLNDDPAVVEKYGRFTPHSFRDTFCSRIQERGLPSAAAQQLLGHATDSMTRKYTHLESQDVAKKAAALLSQ